MKYRRARLFTFGLPIRAAFGLALASAIYSSSQRLAHPPAPPKHPVVRPLSSGWQAGFEERANEITASLAALRLPFPLPRASEEQNGSGSFQWIHRRYRLTVPKPADLDAFERLFDPLKTAPPEVEIRQTSNATGAELTIGVHGLRTHTLNFQWLDRSPRVALIVMGLGNDLLAVREVAALGVPVTYAVAPFRPFSGATAERAALAGAEVLVQLPLQIGAAEDAAGKFLGPKAGDAEISAVVDDAFAEIPQAVGIANDAASKFTDDPAQMGRLFECLKRRQGLYVDGANAQKSGVCGLAQQSGVPCAHSVAVLDRIDEEATATARLKGLLETARTQGDLIVIAYPQPAVIAALRSELPRFRESGVELVPLSQLLPRASLSPG